MLRSIIPVLLLAASVRPNALESSYTAQDVQALQPRQGLDSALIQSQQSEQGAPPADTPKAVLTDGTPVRLKFVRAAASSQVIAGEKVPLEVIEPVLAGNLIAISQHTQAEAIVMMAQAKRSMGRGGNLELKIESIRLADGESVPLRAVKDVKGEERKAVAIAVWSIWPYVNGKNAMVRAGTEITAYIAGDFALDPSKFKTAAMSLQEKSGPK